MPQKTASCTEIDLKETFRFEAVLISAEGSHLIQ